MRDDQLAATLAEAALRVHRRWRQEELVHGLTGARLAVLARLAADGPRSVGALARAEGVAPATMTRLIDALEEARLVVRARTGDDARLVRVVPTALGKTLLHSARSGGLAWLERSIGMLDAEARGTLERSAEVLLGLVEGEVKPTG
jgi:DNA-binding MarR family transcriptional regulator